GQAKRQAARIERKVLPRLIRPGPFAVAVMVGEDRARTVLPLHLPGIEPPLAMQRARVAGHVGLEPDGAAAEGETAAADSVHIGNEREAIGVEDLFERTVAFAQYRPRTAFIRPLERRNSAANRRA